MIKIEKMTPTYESYFNILKKLCTKYNLVLQDINIKDSLEKNIDSYQSAIDIYLCDPIKKYLLKLVQKGMMMNHR